MASYFNLTLDTLAPSNVVIKLNDGALYASSTTVTLKTTLDDQQTAGFQMKIWGIDGVDSESASSWESFTAQKSITLPSGDGLKTVYVKVRDDVGNESETASASITISTTMPVVTVTGPDKSKISKIAGFDTAVINFSADQEFDEYKVMVVPESASEHDDGAQIPMTAGSLNTSGSDGNYPASSQIKVTIKGADLESASGGDGVKIVKVFVKNKAGLWSVA